MAWSQPSGECGALGVACDPVLQLRVQLPGVAWHVFEMHGHPPSRQVLEREEKKKRRQRLEKIRQKRQQNQSLSKAL